MRKFLLSAVALTAIAVAAPIAGASVAQAQPAFYPQYEGGGVYPAQGYDWRRREELRRHEEWERARRHEQWRRHHAEYERRGW